MKGIDLKKRLQQTGKSITEISRMIGMTQQSLSQALLAKDIKSGLIELLAEKLEKPIQYFYGDDSTNNVVKPKKDSHETLLSMLSKKDEQIDRLINIIENKA